MNPQHFGNLLHRFELGSHGSSAPGVKEFTGPGRGTVGPESLKIFLEQIGPDGSEVAREQLLQFIHLFIGEVFRSFQQTPAAFGQERFFAFALQLLGLVRSDLVDGLAHVAHDMKPVENIDGTRCLFGNDDQIGFPHVTANKPQLLTPLRPEPAEEFPEGFGGTIWSDPQQAPSPLVKLIHQSDKLILAFSPADFVGADGGDPAEITMFEPPGDCHFHRAKDTVPTGFEDFRHFFPAQPLTPGGQKPGIGYRELTFPRRPRQLFDLDATGWTLYPSWGVEEEGRYAPQGNKGKAPDTKGVIAGSSLTTLGTDGLATDLGTQGYHQGRWPGVSPVAGVVDKTRLFFDTVQDSLYVHPVWPTLRSSLEETFPGKVRQDVLHEKPVAGQYWQ